MKCVHEQEPRSVHGALAEDMCDQMRSALEKTCLLIHLSVGDAEPCLYYEIVFILGVTIRGHVRLDEARGCPYLEERWELYSFSFFRLISTSSFGFFLGALACARTLHPIRARRSIVHRLEPPICEILTLGSTVGFSESSMP